MLRWLINSVIIATITSVFAAFLSAMVMEVIRGVFKSMETNSWVDLPLKEEVVRHFTNLTIRGRVRKK